MNPLHVFAEIGKGFKWLGKEIGKAFVDLPKIICLTEDAEAAASTVLPETIAVVQDAGTLATATMKDSGTFLTALAGLSAAVAKAIADKALNVAEDVAVVTAFQAFCGTFKSANVADMLNAWHQLTTDTKTLDASVIATLKKLETDWAQ
jgi:hypothetical protein